MTASLQMNIDYLQECLDGFEMRIRQAIGLGDIHYVLAYEAEAQRIRDELMRDRLAIALQDIAAWEAGDDEQ